MKALLVIAKLKVEVGSIGYIHIEKVRGLKPVKDIGNLDIMSRVEHIAKGVS